MPADNFEFYLNYSGTSNFSWATGNANLTSQNVKVVHRFPFLLYPDFIDFRLKVIISFQNSTISWLNVTGDGIVNNIKSPLTLGTNSFLNFENLDLLSSGVYQADIYYMLEGFSSVNGWSDLESRDLSFNLTITAGNQIKTEKQIYTQYYNKSTDTLSGETHINIENNTDDIDLYFQGDSETYVAVSSFKTSFDLLYSSNTYFPVSGEYVVNAFIGKLVGGSFQRIYNFKIKIIIIDAEVVVSPQSLSFEVRKSIQEIKTLSVSIVNPFGKVVNISGPNWLTLDPASGNTTFDFSVSNVNPNTLSGGILTGNIEVQYDAATILLPVTLNVIEFYIHNLQEQYNFCLDNKVINVYKNLDTARFVRITATMRFRTPTETKDLIVPYIVPYFNDQVKLEIGKKIHRYFLKNRTSIFEEGTIIYNFDNRVHIYPCEASFKVEELDVNQLSIYEESFSGIKLYPGKKPKYFPFLTNFGIRSRVYDSKHIFSFISGLVTAEELFDINVTKNGLEAGCIARVKVERAENKITWTDEKTITAGGQTLQYYNLIEGKDVVNVQWENQNLSPESITFKGLSNQPKELTHLFQENIFTGGSEKFDTTAVKTINISTGFILKSEEALIEELMFSKFCILEIGGNFIKAAPSTSKIVTEDKSKQLIEFDLEFNINGN